MNSFKGLIKKEVMITKYWFFTGIVLVIFAFIAGMSFGSYFENPHLLVIVSLVVIAAHGLYVSLYLLSSLMIEGRTQLWLHNPNSSILLFLAKLSSGVIFLVISVIISTFLSSWAFLATLSQSDLEFLGEASIYKTVGLMGIGVTFISIYLGVWVLFYWTVFHSMKSITVLRDIRWPALIGLWFFITLTNQLLQETFIYEKISSLWMIETGIINYFESSPGQNPAAFREVAELSLGSGLFYAAITVLIFLFASRLLERKVEV